MGVVGFSADIETLPRECTECGMRCDGWAVRCSTSLLGGQSPNCSPLAAADEPGPAIQGQQGVVGTVRNQPCDRVLHLQCRPHVGYGGHRLSVQRGSGVGVPKAARAWTHTDRSSNRKRWVNIRNNNNSDNSDNSSTVTAATASVKAAAVTAAGAATTASPSDPGGDKPILLRHCGANINAKERHVLSRLGL